MMMALKTPNRPAIFVCHSLGGIITKEVRSDASLPYVLFLYALAVNLLLVILALRLFAYPKIRRFNHIFQACIPPPMVLSFLELPTGVPL